MIFMDIISVTSFSSKRLIQTRVFICDVKKYLGI